MRIHSTSDIRHPRKAAFEAYRDRLPDIAPYIDDIREIRVLNRTDEGPVSRLHNLWVADKEIPRFARAILKPEMLQWDDFAVWDEGAFQVRWQLKTRAFADSVRCAGTNTFHSLGPGLTRVELEGELNIDVASIPGVPRLLAGRLGPQVEAFIVALIGPNLKRVNDSLERFLDDQKR